MSDKAETTKYIVYGSVGVVVLVFAYFGIIKPITNKLGLTRDKDEREGDRDREKIGRQQTLSPVLYNKNKDKVTISSARANQLATQIYEGDGYVDDEAKGVGAIQNTGSLVNLSYVSKVFYDKTGIGLETFLEGTGMVDYMEERHWDTIDDYISKTKKY